MITIKNLFKIRPACFNIKVYKEGTMKKLLSIGLAAIALLASTAASVGCMWILIDEPKALKNMD